MSFGEKIKITAGCLALLATYAFAEHNDEMARLEDEAMANKGIVVVSCTDVQPTDPDSHVMECAP